MEKRKENVACAFCRGTGRARGAVCQVCGGAGMVSLSAPTKHCAYCRGTGLQQRASALTCGVCKGVGSVTVDEDSVLCPSCSGTGVEPAVLGESKLPCLTCQGKGVISAERAKKLPPEKRRPPGRGRGHGSRKLNLEY